MSSKTKYYIVAADALPDIFIKVAEAKRMLQTGEASTVGSATKKVGISRSAFYKYKDSEATWIIQVLFLFPSIEEQFHKIFPNIRKRKVKAVARMVIITMLF